MYVVCVQLRVKEAKIEEFLRYTIDNATNARKEPGCLRFDVVRHESERDRFLFYEVYKTPDDLKAHHQTAHYLRWRDHVPDLLAEPRASGRYLNVDPADADWR